VLATGRLKTRQWTAEDGSSREALELEAYAVGHDLNRGTSAFRRAERRPVEERPLRTAADELAAAVAREPLDQLAVAASSRSLEPEAAA